MFGKPEWFVPLRVGWGLTPVTRQGWIYALSWAAVIGIPFILLLLSNGAVHAAIWLGVMIAALVVDVAAILRAINAPEPVDAEVAAESAPDTAAETEEDDVLMIMDEEETRSDRLQTGRFDMRVAERSEP